MWAFIGKRLLYMFLTVIVVTMVSFVIIQLPPGDYLTSYVMQLKASGADIDQATLATLTAQYGLDLPVHQQYFKWMGNILKGDFGLSMGWNRPVLDLVKERMGYTVGISLLSVFFSYILAISTGIFSATRQYSLFDYVLSMLAFIGMSIPGFLLALILLYLIFRQTGTAMVGLFSNEFIQAPWSWAKVWDLMKHLPVPVAINSAASLAGLFRIMRGCMLDELDKQYVTCARAKGLRESKIILKYPTRIALNPITSSLAWVFPQIISAGTIIAIVLGLPTVGSLLLQSLKNQDMYLAGSLVMFLAVLTVIGSFVSDLLLMRIDPRIRMR